MSPFATHGRLYHACPRFAMQMPPCGQTDACEYITFPQLLLRTVIIGLRPIFGVGSGKSSVCHMLKIWLSEPLTLTSIQCDEWIQVLTSR